MSDFCNVKATHIFSARNINVFAIYQDRNFNVTLANNFVKFWTTGSWCIFAEHSSCSMNKGVFPPMCCKRRQLRFEIARVVGKETTFLFPILFFAVFINNIALTLILRAKKRDFILFFLVVNSFLSVLLILGMLGENSADHTRKYFLGKKYSPEDTLNYIFLRKKGFDISVQIVSETNCMKCQNIFFWEK